MLSNQQRAFVKQFLHPYKQRWFFWKKLPMALLGKVRLIELNEEKAVATVPFNRRNINPFDSMYFAVQSMAAELSTAAPALLAIRGREFTVSLIIVNMEATFSKKAKTRLEFTCLNYPDYQEAIDSLNQAGDIAEVTATTEGRDESGDLVASFQFTWTFKRRD